MTEPSPPAWIAKRDGRLVPFDADKISRALFAASEALGRPDAFLARELTDGILHFLLAECSAATPTTAQVSDLVIKVVRELGHPALAQAFADFAHQRPRVDTAARSAGTPPPAPVATPLDHWIATARSSRILARRAADAALRDYALREVFARDIAAAHADGLLLLGDLHAPLELAGCVLDSTQQASGLIEAIEEARTLTGSALAIDGPEYSLARGTGDAAAMASYVRELGIGLRATGLQGIVNLNCAAPPSWAEELADGPLFAEQRRPSEIEPLTALQDGLLDLVLTADGAHRIDWHLSERDFTPAAEGRLLRLARRALEGSAIAFVLDRPRRLVGLAEGIDRRHPAVLLRVGLDLVRLSELPGLHNDHALFLQKLGSLARLALSAASQKRDFLRRHSEGRLALTRGFLLERARLLAVPIGLDEVVRSLTGRSLCAGGAGLDLARQIILRLRDTLRQDGRHRHLDCCLDSCAGFSIDESADSSALPLPPRVAGLTPWELGAPAKQQLRAAGALHAAAEMGSAALLFSEDQGMTAEEAVQWLRHAWQHTDVARLSFVRVPQSQRQLTIV